MNYYLPKYLHDTGKTAAFLLPILHKILDDGFEESCAGNPKCFIHHKVGLEMWQVLHSLETAACLKSS